MVLSERVLVVLNSTKPSAYCPLCNGLSSRVHSRYTRTLTDLPWAELQVRLLLKVRRFFCPNAACPRRTFAERLGEEIAAYARRTTRLGQRLLSIGLALGGEAGARLLAKLGLEQVSPATLLNLIRKASLPSFPTPEVLGVDDFAFRRGDNYGAILVDLQRHRVIDLLRDRQAESLAQWLKAHPGVKVISRDRAGAFAEGARRGAPQAKQVADRFHLVKNLGELVERIFEQYPAYLQKVNNLEAEPEPTLPGETTKPEGEQVGLDFPQTLPLKVNEARRQARRTRRLALYEQVKTLTSLGYPQRVIAQQVGLSRTTVIQWQASASFPERVRPARRGSKLDPYLPYLQKRWQEGCHSAVALYKEINQQGFEGARSLVSNYLSQLRAQLPGALQQRRQRGAPVTTATSPLAEKKLRPRGAAWLFVKAPSELKESQLEKVRALCESSEDLAETYRLAQAFRAMVKERQSEGLGPWLEQAKASRVKGWKGFAQGIVRDLEAVKAGLSLEWSNGEVEGDINRLKLIKREMFGRAELDLLKLRVIGPAIPTAREREVRRFKRRFNLAV